MAQAKTARERRSQDDLAWQLAEDRRRAEIIRAQDREIDFAEGMAKGRVEGRLEGRAEVRAEWFEEGRALELRVRIAELAEDHGVELTEERRAQIERASATELDVLKRHLRAHRRWP